MFRALCAHHQEVKIILYSIWLVISVSDQPVHMLTAESALNLCTGRPPTGVMIPDAV